ncbi:Arsenate reductase [Candidatus Rhodobacter oscarellae]|uniref:Arsenate reductase n=1 Tax=Candidatus Rhodobacter oscarellae TaxID=1675527 RepID=A0A0J9EAE9_9RHOB|nr:arsenate reductase (glutaredoxin) [Candidatus Rhodobacter lobularis]KMW59767.1 Arsenate reductase [Candidatus Rhodobacter lobularis]
MTITIWHNPRCSKSRQTLALLEGREVEIRLYVQDPPSAAELRDALAALQRPAIELVRTGEAEFKAAGLTKQSSEDALVAAMAKHPKLIERPVVFANGKAALGRPPEAVLKLL